jgi:hypothetical protein
MAEEEIGGPEVDSAPVESAEPVATTEDSQSVAAPQQQEVWGAFRQLPQFQGQEDRAIAQRLYEAMHREEAANRALQQYQSAIPVVQDYLQNRPHYEKWRASQAQPQAAQASPASPAQKPEPGWWNPPEVKDSYKRYLTRDENGREVIAPDAPLDARAALEDYQQYRADFAQRFLDNPEQTLGPMVEKVAMQRAAELVDQRFSRMKDENYVSTLENENKDWLYDQNGNVSAEGMSVQKYIQDAKGLGISGAKARWDFATKMVERDLLLANLRQPSQQQQAPQQVPQLPQPQVQQPTAEQANMAFLRQQAMRTASQRPAAQTTARTPSKAMTFEERLTAAAQEEGLL